ncbi:beta-L-arabinofuranosidase domain-containing protein [Sphingobacterium hungaricum]
MKRYVLVFVSLIFSVLAIQAQNRESTIQLFPLEDVQLLPSPFEQAMELNKSYLLSLDADRLLAPYQKEAGLKPKAENYTNWENTGLDGHIGGHYLSALSLMYASTKDNEIKAKIDYMLSELKRCQDASGNGYIGGVPGSKALWAEIKEGNIEAGNFDLNKKWVPLYNIHKVYAGLRDAYLFSHSELAKEMLIRMTDWAVDLVSQLSDDQIQDMLRSEYGGLNEVFADAAIISGNKKYLKLAEQFTQRKILDPLIDHQDQLTGLHANTQIPKIIGAKRIADLQGNEAWDSASRFFWETVVQNRTVSIGGNSAYEHFHPSDDFSKMITSVEGPETCNTYNMLKLSVQLFQSEGDVRYVDYYEGALYNHILSTQHPVHGGFVYFTPMRPGHYRVYSQPQTSFWCCVGSGLENHSKYGEFIYAHHDDALFVNLFIPSILDWNEKGIEIIQNTKFPFEETAQILVNPKRPEKFTLNLRYPTWVKSGEMKLKINGQLQEIKNNPGEYISINRLWEKGDKIELELGMHVSVEQLPDHSDYYSFLFGPIVLASKTNSDDMDGLLADDSRGGHIAKGKQLPIQDLPYLVSNKNELENLPELISHRELRFRLNNVYQHANQIEEELIPFYQIHDSRYIIYYPQSHSNESANSYFNSEAYLFSRKLDSLTVDKVSCGQQQPESDHRIEFDQSSTGLTEGVQWRVAKGWFGYDLANKKQTGEYLHIQFFDIDRPSDFDILINDIPLSNVRLEGNKEKNSLQLILPESLRKSEKLTIRFVAKAGSSTAKISEVRLLSGKLGD